MSSQFVSCDLAARSQSANRGSAGTNAAEHSWIPAVVLFFVAPLVAEFLLGNMSITHVGMLVLLAPLYGGGAVLIRESVRRTGRGWASILVLALAYGVQEEAFLMQSLFNADFLGLHLRLLEPAYLPALGMGAWYTVFVLTLHTVFVLTLHTVWSISVPIALVEGLFPHRAAGRWVGGRGLGFVAILFVLASVSIGVSTMRRDPHHFVASPLQFAWSAAVIVALAAVAFAVSPATGARRSGGVPAPWIPGVWCLGLASAFLMVPWTWGWWAVAAYGALDLLAILPIRGWSGRAGWGAMHRLSVAGGAAMAYAWHAFVETPSLGGPGDVTRAGNGVFLILAIGFIWSGARRTAAAQGEKVATGPESRYL